MTGIIKQLNGLFKSRIHFGIDIGASSVKVVVVKNNHTRPEIIGAALQETPHGCVQDGVLCEIPTMVDILAQALAATGVKHKGHQAVIGIHGLNVIYKRLLLPSQGDDELYQSVRLEAQQQVDSELDEWQLDYQKLSATNASGQIAVMLAAAKKSALDEYITLLSMVGLYPAVFDCDVFALENAHEFGTGKKDSVLLLDIGRDTTKINLVHDGVCVVARSIGMGGYQLSESIARTLSVDIAQAEQIKLSYGGPNAVAPEHVGPLIQGHIDEISDEIRRTVDFFVNERSEHQIEKIEKISLSGGGSSLIGISEGLSKTFGARAELSNPFQMISLSAAAERVILECPHLYTVALGLGLRHAEDRKK